ncbi:MAG: hypothetical protein VX460_14290 [Planctomycetota bacterium]|nr:hypothetical protein [Planctomycetota bacterium]
MALRTMPLRAALVLAALHLCSAAGAQDEVTARWELDPRAPYVGQTFELRLAIELDADWSDRALAQLYARELDLPLQIDALPAPIPGLTTGPIEGEGPSLVVDGQVVRTDGDARAGARRRVTITRSGRLDSGAPVHLPAPLVRFVAASGFRDDPVQGEVAEDPREDSHLGEPLQVTARALPEEGRPVEFAGAIGSLSLRSSISPRAFTTGSTVELTVEVSGPGALPPGAAPALVDVGPWFELLGAPRRESRRFHFALRSLREGPGRAPGARLSTFDPSVNGGEWRTLTVEGPPIAVRAGVASSHADAPAPPGTGEEIPPLPWTFVTLGAVAALALVSAVRRIAYRAAVRAEAQAGADS